MVPIDSFQGVITFVVAARCQSFTKAADQLGVSKSAVGKAIARLESRLGIQLFHRTTRRISLTADGDAYFAVCAVAMDEISAAESGLGPGAREPSGRLRVDIPVAFGRRVVAPILFSNRQEVSRPTAQYDFLGSSSGSCRRRHRSLGSVR